MMRTAVPAFLLRALPVLVVLQLQRGAAVEPDTTATKERGATHCELNWMMPDGVFNIFVCQTGGRLPKGSPQRETCCPKEEFDAITATTTSGPNASSPAISQMREAYPRYAAGSGAQIMYNGQKKKLF